jgi:hypothetical protein
MVYINTSFLNIVGNYTQRSVIIIDTNLDVSCTVWIFFIHRTLNTGQRYKITTNSNFVFVQTLFCKNEDRTNFGLTFVLIKTHQRDYVKHVAEMFAKKPSTNSNSSDNV